VTKIKTKQKGNEPTKMNARVTSKHAPLVRRKCVGMQGIFKIPYFIEFLLLRVRSLMVSYNFGINFGINFVRSSFVKIEPSLDLGIFFE
jgi:hypothetical protein